MFLNKNKEQYLNWIDYIIPGYFLISLVECYIGHWHLNVFIKVLGILLSVLLLCKTRVCNSKIVVITKIFMVYLLLTILMYAFNGRPVSLVSDDFMNMLPAMLFVWVGASDSRSDAPFYKKFLVYGGIIFAVGLICYLGNVDWYMSRMAEARNRLAYINADVYDADSIWASLRFCSFFSDSYQVSHFATWGLGMALFFVSSVKRFKWDYVVLVVFTLACFLSQHRVAIAAGSAALLFFFCYKRVYTSLRFVFIFVFFVIIFVGAYMYLNTNYSEQMSILSDNLIGRLDEMSYSKAMEGSRNDKTARLMQDFDSIVFGEGLGCASPTAARYGLSCVTDGAFIKLLFETGYVGLMFFLCIVFISIMRGLRHFKYLFVDLFVISFTLAAMIGSNTLTMGYLLTIPFWYALGHIWNNEYLDKAIKDNVKI